jgi:hypothetical protein
VRTGTGYQTLRSGRLIKQNNAGRPDRSVAIRPITVLWHALPNLFRKDIMEMQHIDQANQYALRIEGCDWMDDLTLEQVWSALKSAYQQLQQTQDLLFITLLPNGEMPARCLPKAMFDYCMASPSMLAETLAPVMAPTLLLSDETEREPAGGN